MNTFHPEMLVSEIDFVHIIYLKNKTHIFIFLNFIYELKNIKNFYNYKTFYFLFMFLFY